LETGSQLPQARALAPQEASRQIEVRQRSQVREVLQALVAEQVAPTENQMTQAVGPQPGQLLATPREPEAPGVEGLQGTGAHGLQARLGQLPAPRDVQRSTPFLGTKRTSTSTVVLEQRSEIGMGQIRDAGEGQGINRGGEGEVRLAPQAQRDGPDTDTPELWQPLHLCPLLHVQRWCPGEAQ
jgi:hypothetical protein